MVALTRRKALCSIYLSSLPILVFHVISGLVLLAAPTYWAWEAKSTGLVEDPPKGRVESAGDSKQLDSARAVKPVAIIPPSVAVPVGEAQSFKLLDDRGQPIRGATWTVSDPTLATLQADGSATLTGSAPGRVTLTATWKGQSAEAQVRILGTGVPVVSGSAAAWKRIWITPNTLSMVVDEARMVRLNDEHGLPIRGVQWSVNDTSIIEVFSQTPTDVVLRGRRPGEATVTGSWQGQLADAKVTVFPGPELPDGSIPWSIEPMPGYSTVGFIQAQPVLMNGPDIFITEHDGCGNYVSRGFTIDGREMWRKSLEINQGQNAAAGSSNAPARSRLPSRIPRGALAARPELMNPPPAKCSSNPAAPPPTSPQEAVK